MSSSDPLELKRTKFEIVDDDRLVITGDGPLGTTESPSSMLQISNIPEPFLPCGEHRERKCLDCGGELHPKRPDPSGAPYGGEDGAGDTHIFHECEDCQKVHTLIYVFSGEIVEAND